MNERTIIFKQGEENGIVIEKDNFNHSIFLDQYQQAINIFHSQWTMQKNTSCSSQISYRLDNQFSNVIAFCGDRGEGKTSCMSSFATILTDEVARKNAHIMTIPEGFIACDNIEWLDTIDPSFFDTTHNLLELLLGRMYAKVTEMNKKWTSDTKPEKAHALRLLKEHFHRVKRDVSMIDSKSINYDELEEISDLAAGVNLKFDLQQLIKHYLSYMDKECLLICIDDLDLNISEGYMMAEMLRKYLITPQCIILVAVKVEQLINIIANAHRKEIKDFEINWEQCQQMAQKYVTKLLPRGNRVTMPMPNDICEQKLQLVDLGAETDELGIGDITVKERVVQLIFQKTGYVFYNAQHLSPIVPKNLRELRHFLSTLESLPDAKDAEGKDNEMGRNIFKDYFFGTWASQLSNKDFTFARQLAAYNNLTTFNAFVIEYFSNRVKEAKIEIQAQTISKTDDAEESEIYTGDYAPLYLDITNRINTSANLSVGDVMYVLWLVSTITVNEEIHKLIFFIKTVYSMRLYACYNEITANKDISLFPEIDYTQSHISIHKADSMYDNVNSLQRLVNGSYFSYPMGSLLSNKTDRFVVDFKKIRELFGKLKDAQKNRTPENEAEFISLLNLCEYFALTITYASTQENIYNANFCRTTKTPTFLGVFSHTAKRAVFDFLNPFYAIANIKYAYHRFDKILSDSPSDYDERNPLEQNKLYEIACKEDNSLLSQFKQIRKNDYDDSWDMHGFISDAIVRVIDVQWAIYEELLRQYRTHRVGAITKKISLAYNDIQSLRITLYPRINIENNKIVEGVQAYKLEFDFLNVLNEVHKKYESKIEEYLTSISLAKQSKVEELKSALDFEQNVKAAFQRWKVWPRKGKDIVNRILEKSSIEKNKKTQLRLYLRTIFEPNTIYTYEEVMSKINNVLAMYMTIYKSKN